MKKYLRELNENIDLLESMTELSRTQQRLSAAVLYHKAQSHRKESLEYMKAEIGDRIDEIINNLK